MDCLALFKEFQRSTQKNNFFVHEMNIKKDDILNIRYTCIHSVDNNTYKFEENNLNNFFKINDIERKNSNYYSNLNYSNLNKLDNIENLTVTIKIKKYFSWL
jgi:hypothetical protein